MNFELTDSLRNNGTEYLLIFHGSCEMICNSKLLAEIAFAQKHHGLRSIYIKHNLFWTLGQDVDLQNRHIVLCKYPLDVMQIITLSAQLGLGSELVDWYRDARSVPYGHISIDLSPRRDDRLRYCTNTGSISSKFYIPDRPEQSKFLDDEHTKIL